MSTKPYLQLGGDAGKPLAIIRGGANDGEIVYLCEGELSEKDAPFNKTEMRLINTLIDEQLKLHSTNNRTKERSKNAEIIRRTMENGGSIKDELLSDIYKVVKSEFNRKKDIEIDILDGVFEIIPSANGDRECSYAGAPSGSGKSYWVGSYARQYNKLYPKNKVFLFSKVEDDVSLKGIKNLITVKLDYQLVDDPITTEELKDSLCIFDDTDTIKDKDIRLAINELKSDILETGRHFNVTTVITSHLLCNRNETKTVLNESHNYIVYPSSGSAYQIKYLLRNYVGLGNEDIRNIFKLNSRWVCIRKNYPQIVISEHKIYLVSGSNAL
jgi:hypothetical protein